MDTHMILVHLLATELILTRFTMVQWFADGRMMEIFDTVDELHFTLVVRT